MEIVIRSAAENLLPQILTCAMVISQQGKIIRIDTRQVCAAGRATKPALCEVEGSSS